MPLLPDQRARLTKLLGKTGSDADAEALMALRYAQRLMKEAGVTWDETLNGTGMPSYLEGFLKGHREGFSEGYAKGLKEGKNSPRARPRAWRDAVDEMLRETGSLTEWEEKFLQSFRYRRWHTPSAKQRAILARIAEKLDVELPDEEPGPEPPF